METVSWTEAMNVGVERIDTEHKVLLAMLNELSQAVASSHGQTAVARTATRMRQYAQEHFRTEEDAMLATNFPARTRHIAEHDQFIEKVLDLEEAMSVGGAVAAAEIWAFLRAWLTGHIMVLDKALGQHLCALEYKEA